MNSCWDISGFGDTGYPGCGSVLLGRWCLSSESIMVPSSSVLGTADPVAQCHISEELNLKHHQCENLSHIWNMYLLEKDELSLYCAPVLYGFFLSFFFSLFF